MKSLLRSSYFFAFILTLSVFVMPVYAQNWLDADNITIKQTDEFTDVNKKPNTRHGNNIDCVERNIKLREAKTLSIPAVTELNGQDCMVDAVYGSIGGSYFLKTGNDVAGDLKLRSHKEFLVAGKNLRTGIIANTSAPSGLYISLVSNITTSIDTKILSDGRIEYSLNSNADVQDLINTQNQRLVAHFDSVSFSSNGEWMMFDSPYYGLVRVNTLSGEILSFGEPTNYNRVNPRYNTAISADGRHAIISTSRVFKIYDLNSCVDQSGALSYLKNCQVKDLEPIRTEQANFGSSATYLRFRDSNIFTYLASDLVNSEVVYKKYQVSIGDLPEFDMNYLGLGDSFSSGEGAYDYKAFTDTDENKCHLSLSSYPYLIGLNQNYESYESVACSGAVMDDAISNDSVKYNGQFNQYISTPETDINIISNFIPGSITQSRIVENIDPEIVTISIGGNDIAFAGKLTECIFGGFSLDQTCFDSYEERKSILNELDNLVPKLVKTYQELKSDNRRVYVVGYPKLVKPGGNCAINVRFNEKETYFADKLITLLNDAVESATKQAGVFYVDVEGIFIGQRLCETESTKVLVNGLTEGDDAGKFGIKIIARESFHPKKEAHAIFSDAILMQTSNLTAPMPSPDLSQIYPQLSDTDDFLRVVDKKDTTIYVPRYIDLVDDRINKNQSYNLFVNQAETGFDPFETFSIEIHSTPINVGTFQTNSEGDINISMIIPDTVPPGYHTVHIYGQNSADQQLDVYDYVLIGESDTDFDGDGTLDKDEPCVFVAVANLDSDQDGFDDACDDIRNQIKTVSINDTNTTANDSLNSTHDQDKTDNSNESDSLINLLSSSLPTNLLINNFAQNSANNVPNSSQSSDQSAQETDNTESSDDSLTVDVKPSTLDDKPANTPVADSKVYLFYLGAAIVAFFGLVAGIFIARR